MRKLAPENQLYLFVQLAYAQHALQREHARDVLLVSLAQLANSSLDTQAAFRQAKQQLERLIAMRSGLAQVAPEEEVRQLMAEWESVYGKLDDPETQERIRRTVEALTPT